MLYRGKAILVRTKGKMYTVAHITNVHPDGVKYQFKGNRRMTRVVWADLDAYFSTHSNNLARMLRGELFVSEPARPCRNTPINHETV